MISLGLTILALVIPMSASLALENSEGVTQWIVRCWLKFYPEHERAELYEQLCADFIDADKPRTSIFRALCFGTAALPTAARKIKSDIKNSTPAEDLRKAYAVSGFMILIIASYIYIRRSKVSSNFDAGLDEDENDQEAPASPISRPTTVEE